MKHARSITIAASLVAALGAVACVGWLLFRTPTPTFRIHRDIEFARVDGQALLLDLYLPTDQDPPPEVIIWLHGGGWEFGDKEHNPLRWLAMEGYAIVTVNYRLSSQAVFPAAVFDCKAVVRWLRANQRRYGFNAQRIAAAGGSAGGHLAAMLGTTQDVKSLEGDVGPHLQESSAVQAVISYFGPVDLMIDEDQAQVPLNKGIIRFLGQAPWENPSIARAASPLYHITADDAPMLIFHGTQDDVVAMKQSELLHEACLQKGVESLLIRVEEAGHDGPLFYDEQRRAPVRAFLARHLRQ